MPQLIRVLHTESSPHLGGQELRILLEMEGLIPFGIESILIARSGTKIVAEARRRGLKVYEVPMYNRMDPISAFMVARVMCREKISVVNSHGSRDAWASLPVARLLGIPTIRSRHVANPIRNHGPGKLIYGALADSVMTTSESIRDGMMAAGVDGGKIVSIPTGVDMNIYGHRSEAKPFRGEFSIPTTARLIGMISVLRGDKGPDVFLKAISKVLDNCSDAWAVLVGDGWMRADLEALLATLPNRERIVMTGFRRDIPQILCELDISVLPAKIPEGVPQIVLQTFASRVPMVASAVGGVSEVAIGEVTAVSVPPGDIPALSAAVLALLNDCALAARLVDKAYGLVRDKYAMNVMLRRMDELYRSLVRPRPR